MIQGDEENPGLSELPADLPYEPAPEDELPQEILNPESSDLGDSSELPSPAEEAASGEPDADASVDELLSAEVLPEGLDLLPQPDAPALPQVPTFQVRLLSLSAEARAPLKRFLDAQAIVVGEKAWAAASPVISQLTEFQVLALLQTARALGVPVEAQVLLPDAPIPTEDELALGELSSIPEAVPGAQESAPSVTLPKGEKDVVLCSPDQLPGASVRETFGLVTAHRSIARRLFREEDLREKLQKELKAVPNRPQAQLPSSLLQIALRDLLLDLRKSALSKGANCVLGVKLEAFPESSTSDPQLEQLRLVAFGTAAVVEKS